MFAPGDVRGTVAAHARGRQRPAVGDRTIRGDIRIELERLVSRRAQFDRMTTRVERHFAVEVARCPDVVAVDVELQNGLGFHLKPQGSNQWPFFSIFGDCIREVTW